MSDKQSRKVRKIIVDDVEYIWRAHGADYETGEQWVSIWKNKKTIFYGKLHDKKSVKPKEIEAKIREL
jgi:hypothetical protein|tara:strand:- start:109 stop:312 length:204 start_codon:yes stop_codon:yes gene_type:complete